MIQFLRKASPAKLGGVAVLRLDFNTKDDWRMKAALPTVQFLLKHARAIVILSHKGRPLGFQREFSLKNDADNLGQLLKKEVKFFESFNFLKIRDEIKNCKPKSIFVLENLRFMPGEADNDKTFAENLASLGDYFVNDAFAVSHRDNASVSAITGFLPSYAGFELESEILNLSKVMGGVRKPLVVILGGAKIEDKLGVLKYFKDRADSFLIGGALANTLLYMKGMDVGKSLCDKKPGPEIKKLLKYKNIVLPVDFKTEDSAILDIGSGSEKLFEEKIKEAKTVIWNGPLGMIEKEQFARGTLAIARAVGVNAKAFSVVGGGETVMALKKTGLDKQVTFISTGGGAMLDYLAGKVLPGIEALDKKRGGRPARNVSRSDAGRHARSQQKQL